jgi:hypothetical protein
VLIRPLLQPWFLVFSLGIGAMGSWSALGMRRDARTSRRKDALILAAVGWIPVLFWILAQFYGER